MQGGNGEASGFFAGTIGWTFAWRAFILPLLNWKESGTSDMAKQDIAGDGPVLW
jgi:hypothetical protein